MRCCMDCGSELLVGENWLLSSKRHCMYRCTSCKKAKANKISSSYNPTGNPKRMYVNGKYIPKSHPLYKPGRYRSFEDAAFSSLRNYRHTKAGYVYVISNPAWKGWVKVGMAIDAEDRCNSYQTSSPFRDYSLLYSVYVTDRRVIEKKAHKRIAKIAEDRQNEWFFVDPLKAIDCITAILK